MEYPQEKVMPYGEGTSKAEQVEQMFDHIAPTYDRLNHILSLGIDRRWRRTAIQALRPYHPMRILDVATGTGDFAILACRELLPASLVGIDLSEGMLDIARRKAQEAGADWRLTFAREDCTCLSFPSGLFDAVTVAFGIRNFEHLDQGLREMHRVLKPKGHLVILELSTPERFPMRQLFSIYAKGIMPLVGKLVSRDSSAYTYLPQSIRAFPQGEVMQQALLRAGFAEARFRRLTFGTCTLYVATKGTITNHFQNYTSL